MTACLVHYALNALWQVPLLTLTCALAVSLLRPALLTRHLLWVAILLLAVAMPLTGFHPMPSTSPASAGPQIALPDLLATTPASPAFSFSRCYTIAVSPRAQEVIASLYLLAFLFAAARLIVAAFRARRLYTTSKPAALTTRQSLIVSRLCAWFVVQPPLIRFPADPTAGPLLTNIPQPAILLPEPLAQAASAEFAAIIAHELAHLSRRDLAVNLTLRLAALPIAFHPATLILHARIRHTRELLTDRLAASALSSPTAYAESLLKLSQQLFAPPTSPLTAGLFEPSFPNQTPKHPLEERIMKLIAAPKPSPCLAARIVRITASTALFAAALTATSLLHLMPAAQAAQQTESEQTSAAPAPFNPAPQDLTTTDMGQSRTAIKTVVTPTSTTHQVVTVSQDQPLAPPALASPSAPHTQPEPATHESLAIPPVSPVPPIDIHLDQQSIQQMEQSMQQMQKQLESPEFKLQLQHLQDLDSAEFKARFAAAAGQVPQRVQDEVARVNKQLADPNSPISRQIADARKQAGDAQRQVAAAQTQLAAASAQIAEARKHVQDEASRRALDEAQKAVDAARRNP